MIYKVVGGIRPTKPSGELELELSDEIWEVMQSCWSGTPSERPTVEQLTDKLHNIPPNAVTARRVAQRQRTNQEEQPPALTPRSFRNVLRGQEIDFTQNEVNLLKEHAASVGGGENVGQSVVPPAQAPEVAQAQVEGNRNPAPQQ